MEIVADCSEKVLQTGACSNGSSRNICLQRMRGRTAVRREPAYPGGTDPGGRTYKRTVPRSRS